VHAISLLTLPPLFILAESPLTHNRGEMLSAEGTVRLFADGIMMDRGMEDSVDNGSVVCPMAAIVYLMLSHLVLKVFCRRWSVVN